MDIRKKAAMFRRWANILTKKSATAAKQGEGRCYSQDEVAGYYNDLTLKVSSGTVLDDKGIPLSEIAGGELVHFPIAVFQYGLAAYDLWLLGEGMYGDFQKIADWALSKQRSDGSWDAFGPMKSSKYTVSSMCQGEGASLLLRAYAASGDEKYLAAAKRALDFMLMPVSDGGTAVYDEGNLYLEEYPESARRSVLNGWIFSLFGLYDATVTKDMPERGKYQRAYKETLDTLCRSLSLYDTGFWSYYDIRGKIASPAYHELHIALLSALYKLSGRTELMDAKAGFEAYLTKKNKAKAVAVKLVQKLREESDVITVK